MEATHFQGIENVLIKIPSWRCPWEARRGKTDSLSLFLFLLWMKDWPLRGRGFSHTQSLGCKSYPWMPESVCGQDGCARLSEMSQKDRPVSRFWEVARLGMDGTFTHCPTPSCKADSASLKLFLLTQGRTRLFAELSIVEESTAQGRKAPCSTARLSLSSWLSLSGSHVPAKISHL